MVPGLRRRRPQAVWRVVQRGGRRAHPTTTLAAVGRLTSADHQARVVPVRQVPYGERLARNRQLTLLAKVLGRTGGRQCRIDSSWPRVTWPVGRQRTRACS